jgi:hypothetical protein
MRVSRLLSACLVLVALSLAACGTEKREQYPSRQAQNPSRNMVQGKLFGDDGIRFGTRSDDDEDTSQRGGIGVNAFLWRASLDTVSFMPVASADPFGGVILTDWYSPAESGGDERFKVNVYILDRQLRADGIQVSVFRQVKGRDGGWMDAPVAPETTVDLENIILTRARQMRVESQPAD